MRMKSEVLRTSEYKAPAFFRDLIELALKKTPTGGNAKPFSWQWNGFRLHVYHDSKLAEHYLNCNFHGSKISLGCLIASVEISARSQGYQAHVKLTEQLGAEITFSAKGTVLSDADDTKKIEQRKTYRGPFKATLPPNVDNLEEDGIQVRLASTSSLLQDFKKYIVKTDMYLWLQKKAMLSFFNEIRFFDDRFELRGIRSKDLGVGLDVQFMLYAFSFMPWLLSLIIRIPLLNFTFLKASKDSQKNAHFVLITAADTDSLSLVRAGNVVMKTWIELEAQGYQVQPYSNASLPLVAARTGHLPADTSLYFQRLFQTEGPEILQRQFQLDPTEHPIWLLRVGKAKAGGS